MANRVVWLCAIELCLANRVVRAGALELTLANRVVLIVISPAVSCAKLKRKKNWFGTVYVELAADGEAWRTAKSHSSSNPKWEERLTL